VTRQGGAAGAIRGVSRRTVGILAALGSAAAWGLGATTSDYVLSSGMGNDTFLVLELGIGFLVLIGIGAVRGELGGFRHPGLARAATTGLIEPWGAYTLGNIGIIFSSGAFVALVSSLNPVLISLLALPFLGERVSWTHLCRHVRACIVKARSNSPRSPACCAATSRGLRRLCWGLLHPRGDPRR